MTLDLVMQEARGMSDEALMEVVRFMRFIKIDSLRKIEASLLPSLNEKKITYRKAGKRRGQIRITDDFDEPLEDFKEYM